MPTKIEPTEVDFDDAELVKVLKAHGIDRRSLMRVLGAGAGIATFGGAASARPGKGKGKGPDQAKGDGQGNEGGGGNNEGDEGNRGRGTRIDKIYGASYEAKSDTVPSGLVDHTVELHTHGVGTDGVYEGFPAPDDAVDAEPGTPGFQADADDADDLPEFHFQPVGLHVQPGGIVQFTAETPLHTVTAFHPKFNEPPFIQLPTRVPTDHPFTSSLLAAGDSWLYKFTEKGVYDILCLPHVSLGMVMRIVVSSDDDEIGEPGYAGTGLRNADVVLGSQALTPENIKSNGEVMWEDNLGLGGPGSMPRPYVDTLSVEEVETEDSLANFDVKWKVGTPNTTPAPPTLLDSVRLTLYDTSAKGPKSTEDFAGFAVEGKETADTTTLVANDDDGSGHPYQVKLTVRNTAGLTVTQTTSVTESEPE